MNLDERLFINLSYYGIAMQKFTNARDGLARAMLILY